MFFLRKKKRPVIVTIHGFGQRLHSEFDPFASYFRSQKYEVVQFDIYDIDDPNDANEKMWIQRCEQVMKEVQSTHEDIILVGFSMGGVIASYLATIFPVKMLILCAPAFEYLNVSTILNQGMKMVKNIRTQSNTAQKPSAAQTQTFTNIVNQYKESISQVECPVLLLHGTDDEVIPVSSSKNAYKSISSKHRLLLFEGGKHRMLYDHTIQDTIFPIIECMIEGKLIP